jgi:HSP20 family protein
MDVSREDPLTAELQSITEDMGRAFGRLLGGESPRPGGWLPPADVYETDDEVVIALDVPGCHPENLRAEVVEGRLVITGERQQANDAVRRFGAERWSGRFVRSFALQPSVRTDAIRADYTDGVLTLRLRKPEETRPKRISINHQPKQLTERT